MRPPAASLGTSASVGIDREPLDMHVIQSADELRAIAHPLRVRILDCLIAQPLIVRDIGKLLRSSSTKLYYHVGELERAGLVRLVHTEVRSGIQLKYYRAVARYYHLSPAFLHGNRDEVDASAAFMAALVEHSSSQLRKAIGDGLIDRHEDAFVVRRRQVRMSPETASRLRRRIEQLDADVRNLDEPEGSLSIEFSIALFPRVDRQKSLGASSHDERES